MKTIAHSIFSTEDIYLFREGKHTQLYNKFGSKTMKIDGVDGVYFAVFAPSASRVEVIGSFNFWKGDEHMLFVRWDSSGIWEGFIPGIGAGELYKYRIFSNHDEKIREKADPYARRTEEMPKTASVVWDEKHVWKDQKWMAGRSKRNRIDAPVSVYEVHLGSWKKDGIYSLGYQELAEDLVAYVKDMGFTHVEFLPLTEHPYYPSWGYLSTSFFAPTSRYGSPSELKRLIEAFHEAEIGVVMDWVPAHFPSDDFALADFDGSALFEHPDRKKGFHPDWNSLIFNYERPEIVSFLLSSAHFWLSEFHLDGLRVDAVSSMLYLDYSREEGEWEPNEFGGNEYLAAIQFLKDLNISCYSAFPDIIMIAEESTAYNGVTKPVHHGGLGFGLKWMMGWMNDTLRYFAYDPVYRPYHHNEISFSLTYAYSENFMLPLSHDEVVHGKQSILSKMPGDEWQKFANLRLLYTYMFTHPGQKLNFMGNEIGQGEEWNVNESLQWHLLDYPYHKGLQACFRDLNSIFQKETALFQYNFDDRGFEWISYDDSDNCVIVYNRKSDADSLIVICNFTPVPRTDYLIGLSNKGTWKIIFNSDEVTYEGSNFPVNSTYKTQIKEFMGKEHCISMDIPPLSGIVLKKQ